MSSSQSSSASPSDAVRKHKQYLFPAVSMYYQEPIALVKGEGHYVWDDSGRTLQTLAGCGQSRWKKLPTLVPGIHRAHAPYCYRCPFGAQYPTCGLKCAEDLEELILTETTGEIAAFMAETIIGSGGFIVPPPGYFEKATAIARKYGGLFIADEVQT